MWLTENDIKVTDKKYSFHLVTEYKVCIRLMQLSIFSSTFSNFWLGGWEIISNELKKTQDSSKPCDPSRLRFGPPHLQSKAILKQMKRHVL